VSKKAGSSSSSTARSIPTAIAFTFAGSFSDDWFGCTRTCVE
jgi:hypothetical protein